MRRSRRRRAAREPAADTPPVAPPTACWLCARPLGIKVEWHHPVPKSRGGRETVPVHPICHRAIHAAFTNVELAKLPPEADALAQGEGMRRFLAWIADKSADFHAPTRRSSGAR